MTIEFIIGAGIVFGAFAVTLLLGWIVTAPPPTLEERAAELEARVAALEEIVYADDYLPSLRKTPSGGERVG